MNNPTFGTKTIANFDQTRVTKKRGPGDLEPAMGEPGMPKAPGPRRRLYLYIQVARVPRLIQVRRKREEERGKKEEESRRKGGRGEKLY